MYKLIADATTAIMRDDQYGFTPMLLLSLARYGIDSDEGMSLNWDSGAGVLGAAIQSSDFVTTQLKGRLVLAMFPSGSQYTGKAKGVKWSGIVGLRLEFRLRYSTREGDDTLPDEGFVFRVGAAIERAVIDTFQRIGVAWPDEVSYSVPPSCPEGYTLEDIADGFDLVIPISIGFEVDLNF